MYGHVGDLAVCGSCLRLRFSPVHLLVRAIAFCPGDRLPPDPPPAMPRDVSLLYDANGHWRSTD